MSWTRCHVTEPKEDTWTPPQSLKSLPRPWREFLEVSPTTGKFRFREDVLLVGSEVPRCPSLSPALQPVTIIRGFLFPRFPVMLSTHLWPFPRLGSIDREDKVNAINDLSKNIKTLSWTWCRSIPAGCCRETT